MAPRYRRIAVIGAGPAGLAAVRALEQERIFDCIRVFDRRNEVGGMWAHDAEPDEFQARYPEAEKPTEIPPSLSLETPCYTPAAPEKAGLRSPIFDGMDTNAGAQTMAFTHTPIPLFNSEASVRKFGPNNSTRPRATILKYLQELFEPCQHLLCLGTTVERVDKLADGTWVLTLRRQPGTGDGLNPDRDYWWQETFDAVVVASGHFTIASVPEIEGLEDTAAVFPGKFEHSKSYRGTESYTGKKVIVVGGKVSAADLADDLHRVVKEPLYVSLKPDADDFLSDAFTLPKVVKRPMITQISADAEGTVHFADSNVISGFDKIIFATGYRTCYPFLPFEAVTPQNRLAGFYQHIFRMDDPSLTVIGQVQVAITFRVFEYQAVAVSRYFAGRAPNLPSFEEQHDWERQRLEYRGPTDLFHEIRPDFAEYYGWLRDFAGPPEDGTDGYLLPEFEDDWVDSDTEVLHAKNKYWADLTWQDFAKKIGAT